jgi:hypothetical protein
MGLVPRPFPVRVFRPRHLYRVTATVIEFTAHNTKTTIETHHSRINVLKQYFNIFDAHSQFILFRAYLRLRKTKQSNMSNLEAEITEPEPGPAATSLSNDETANKEGPEPTAPTDKGVVPANAESEDVKDAAEVKDEQKTEKSEATTGIEEEKSDKKTERNGSSGEKKERFDDNGVF